jgi:hypothetical protein
MNKDFVTKIATIQKDLKCNKGKKNTFGNFNYRSCEDIFESVKPLLFENDLMLYVSDDIQSINGFNYIKATVTITDGESSISSNGWAKEPDVKKGMDSSQVTGSSSSYARKYAIGGLLMIDDSTDPDSMDNSKPSLPKRPSTLRKDDSVKKTPNPNPTEDQKMSGYLARINELTKDMTPSQKEKAIKNASFDSYGYVDDINAMTKNGVKLNSNQLLQLGKKLAENIKKAKENELKEDVKGETPPIKEEEYRYA